MRILRKLPIVLGFSLVILLLTSGVRMVWAQAGQLGQWSTMGNLMSINPVHAALMNNGKVLIVSGSGNVATETNFRAAVLDPQSGTFTTLALTWDMFCNGMVVL